MSDVARARLRRFEQAAASSSQLIVRTHFTPDAGPTVTQKQERFKRQILMAAATMAAGVSLAAYLTSGSNGEPPVAAPAETAKIDRLATLNRSAAPPAEHKAKQTTTFHSPASVKLVPISYDGKQYQTITAASRLTLVKEAAKSQGLDKVGLNWRDLYGVIHAETSWVSRVGYGKNGVQSHGFAQFEPASAKAYGVRNPQDPVEAVHGSARVLKEAATWAAKRADEFNVPMLKRAQAIRDGVTVYYNLSWKARHEWRPMNNKVLPDATIAHMANVRQGIEIARRLEKAQKAGERLELEQISISVAKAAAAEVKPPTAAPAVKLATSKKAKTFLANQKVVTAQEVAKKRRSLPG